MAIQDAIALFSATKPSVGPIMLDGSLSEDHAVEVDVTEEPIEEGGLVADHQIVRPRVVVIEGLVSAFPDSFLPPQTFTRHLSIWRRFRDIAIRGDLLDVVTTLEVYPGMKLTSVRTRRDVDHTNALVILLTLRKFEFARVDVAQAVADAAQDLALGQAELGAQGTLAKMSTDLTNLGVL